MNNFFTSYWNAMKTGKLFWLTLVFWFVFWMPILDNIFDNIDNSDNIDELYVLYLSAIFIDSILQIILVVIMPYIWFRKTIKLEQRDVPKVTHVLMFIASWITTPYLLIKWNGFKSALISIIFFVLLIIILMGGAEYVQDYI